MRTFPIKNAVGITYAFEIENVYIPAGDVASTLARADGVSGTLPRRPSRSDQYLVSFQFRGHDCVVWEPFGDKSRYWIGPKEAERDVDIAEVEKAFKQYQPALLRRLLGGLLSLRFLRRW
ncbi:hypothetical protein E8F11_04795 [Pseudomonas sp. BN417]|uniref:hypothetical protein n=1 Tax=Pseudomonas sp. BN417 TaxID=2567890 RepID=UPI0024568C00|nr:hypothetical protein [Pseudomonas sp. BN417]MDH4554504.1 hypothetical protein [Pseudomonas sp. BN417]